jgi:hypothetical protein
MKIRVALAAAACSLAFVAAACGGSDDNNSGERPTAEELSAALMEQAGGSGDQASADCVGRELEASDLPNGVLRTLVEGEDTAEIDADNEERYDAIVNEIITTCTNEALSGALDGADGGEGTDGTEPADGADGADDGS